MSTWAGSFHPVSVLPSQTEDERRNASLTLGELVRAFLLPPDWPVTIRRSDGDLTIAAGELVRRIDKQYPRSA